MREESQGDAPSIEHPSLELFEFASQRLDLLMECGLLVLESGELLRFDLAIECQRAEGGALARKLAVYAAYQPVKPTMFRVYDRCGVRNLIGAIVD